MKIAGIDWRVEELAPFDPSLSVDGSRCYGACDYSQRKIFLDRTLPEKVKRKALTPELVHAVIFEYLLGGKDSYSEENVCDLLATYGERVLRSVEAYFCAEKELKDFYSIII